MNDEILARYLPLYTSPGPGSTQQTPPSFTIIWLDPVSIDLQSPQGLNLSYNLSTNAVSNGLGSSFVSVGGNVEMIVLENAAGTFNLDVANVPATARGGVVELSAGGFSSEEFTAAVAGRGDRLPACPGRGRRRRPVSDPILGQPRGGAPRSAGGREPGHAGERRPTASSVAREHRRPSC